MLSVRIEPRGVSAERATAGLCADGSMQRDHAAMLGEPAAEGTCADGAAALSLLVRAATASLDDTDLHCTLQRQ